CEPVVAESAQAPSSPPVRAKRSPRSPASPPQPASQPQPAPPIAAKQKSLGLGARLAGLKAWVGDVVKAKTTPKPKRAVIEIPPRPSPLAKNKAQSTAKTDFPAEAAAQATAKQRSNQAQPPIVTIVDTEATESFDGSDLGDRSQAAAAEDPASPVEETMTEAPTGSPSRGAEVGANTEDTNWADDENWADSGDSFPADPD
ncbi:MAG: hypothetical protein WBG32_22115, partial [Nodosilinea sp.]